MSDSLSQPAGGLAPPRAPATTAGRLTWVDAAMLLVVLIWGVNFAILKVALREIDALAFAALRFGLATAIMAGLALAFEGSLRIHRGDFWKLLGLGLLGNGIYQILFMSGIARTSAGNTSLILATAPIFVAILSALMGYRLRPIAWAGILLSFAGLALIVASGTGTQLGGEHLIGDALVLLAAMCWGGYTALLAPFLRRYSPLKLNALAMLLGTPPLLLVALPSLAQQSWTAVTWQGWGGLMFAVVLSVVVAYLIWNIGVQRVGSARTAVYSNLVPVVALVTAAIVLGEHIYPLQVVGAVVVVSGIVLTRRGR